MLQTIVSLRLGACEVRLTMPTSTKSAVRTTAKNVIQTHRGYSRLIGMPDSDHRLDKPHNARQTGSVRLVKVVEPITIYIQHSGDVPLHVEYRQNDLRPRGGAAGYMA